MTAKLALAVSSLIMLGCGGGTSNNSPPCFTPQPGVGYINRDAIFVANTGSSSVSAFQEVGRPNGPAAGGVCGSPFAMTAPPTALGGGGVVGEEVWLIVLSAPQKTISLFKVDYITSALTGPVATLSTADTPMAVAVWRNYYYIANAEGNVSVYQVPSANAIREITGSPFPAGAGPVAIGAAEPGLLFVANSQSNNVTGYLLDPNTGVPTALPGSPFPAGTGPSSIEVAPPMYPNALGGPTLVIVTNAGSNDVSVYSIGVSGGLIPVPGSPFAAGAAPTSSATGNYLPLKHVYVTNSKSNDISGYSIDDATGALTPLAGSPFPAGLNPSAAAVSLGGYFVYVLNSGSNGLSVFLRDQDTGALTPVSGSPFPVGQSPRALLYFQVPE